MQDRVSCALKHIIQEYLEAFSCMLASPMIDDIGRVVAALSAARSREATIYIAGNGGSASLASHWVNDLGKATKNGVDFPIRVMSLSDNISWVTALANDEGYDRVFSGQLENFGKPGDVLVVISASGNSPNLIRAVELARTRNMTTVGLLGFDGGLLREMVSEYILLPTRKGAYGIVESAHATLCHILTTCLAQPIRSND